MEWSDRYGVGHPVIDAQHRELFRRIGDLTAALRRDDRGEIARMLRFLGNYVVQHFALEEREMQRSGYAAHDLHEAAHDRFVRELLAVKAEYERTGATPWLGAKLDRVVKGWLVEHILGMDQQLARHLSSARAAAR